MMQRSLLTLENLDHDMYKLRNSDDQITILCRQLSVQMKNEFLIASNFSNEVIKILICEVAVLKVVFKSTDSSN